MSVRKTDESTFPLIRRVAPLRKLTSTAKSLSGCRHDLRSPMGSVKMVLNLLLMSLQDATIGKDLFELLTTANHIVEDLFTLLDNLLKWTKSQIGRLKVVYQDFDIVPIIKATMEIFNMVAETKGIKLVMKDINEPINVHADTDMIKTICRNLLSNAIKFSVSGKEVELDIFQQGETAVVSVRDHALQRACYVFNFYFRRSENKGAIITAFSQYLAYQS